MERRRDKDRREDPGRTAVRIVVVDDDDRDRELIRQVVSRDVAPVEIRDVVNHVGFYQALQENLFDIVITEQKLHWSSGPEVLTAVKSLRPAAPVIMVASSPDEEAATEALRDGLDAFLPKGDGFERRLRSSLRSALRRIEFEERIEGLEERLRDLLERLDVGVFQATLDGTIAGSNAAMDRMVPAGDDGGETATLSAAFADPNDFTDLCERLSAEGRVRSELIRWAAPDGGTEWVSLSATLRSAPGGGPVIDGLIQDVTEEQLLREGLERATRDLRAIIENSGAVMVVLQSDGIVEMVNSAFERFSGFARAEVEGAANWSRFMSIADGEHDAERRRVLLAAPESGPRGGRLDFKTRDGRSCRVHATETALPGGERSVVSLVNISERQRIEDRLMHNVFHDGLTGLPNRLALTDRLEALATDEQPGTGSGIGLLVLDVDDFKSVNDRFGARIGDLLLRSMTRRIEGAASGAELVARTGSDSFAVVLHMAVAEAIDKSAEAVVTALSEPFQFGDHSIRCTVSMGAAHATTGAGIATLFRDAESAMYDVRRDGGGRWKWHDE